MEEQKKGSKRFLMIYCIAIFVFAVSLILIASLSQSRQAREADEIKSQLNDAQLLAADSQTRLDGVMTENARLTAEIDALKAAQESANVEKENLNKKLAASQKLSQILNIKLHNGDVTAAVTEFEAQQLAQYLSAEEQKIYNSIKGK